MSESQHPHRLTHGVVWKELAAGDAAGFATADWAYLRPSGHRPIAREELRFATLREQREVVRFWFLLNLQPYSLEGGSWFAFGAQEAGFGQATWAPAPVLAIEPIEREFSELLGPELSAKIASEFPGEWMWGPPPPRLLAEPLHQPAASDLQKEIIARLDSMSARVRNLGSVEVEYGAAGHNSGEEVPFTDDEREVALEIIARSREAASRQDWYSLVQVVQALQPFGQKLGRWLYRKFDLMTDEFARRPWTVPLTIVAFRIAQEIHSLDQLTKLVSLLK